MINDIENELSSWITDNQEDIKKEAELRGMSWEEFLVTILDDALEAYKNGRAKLGL